MRYFQSIVSCTVGNILEWYDFGLFTLFSSLFSKLFFPAHNEYANNIALFGIFAIGFLCRPLGALIFGYLGDTQGRAKTLKLSILMITLPTLLIAFLPTYAQSGLMAPILLVIIRMWQGISIGGEYSGNLIYLAECAPKKHRALFTSFASMGSNLGILLAACVGIIVSVVFSEQALFNGGWRIPYLISGILSLLIYRFRLQLAETLTFDYLLEHAQVVTNPIKVVFTDHWRQLLRTFGLVCMGSTFYYFLFVYIPLYLRDELQISLAQVSALMTFLICIMIILAPLGAFLCDQFGRRKMLLFNALLITGIVIPGFYLLHSAELTIITAVLLLFTLASAFEQGTTPITVIENFAPTARYTGVSLGYNLGNGFLGGTVPLVCAWLASFNNSLAPPAYIALCAVITGAVVLFFVPESKGRSLVS